MGRFFGQSFVLFALLSGYEPVGADEGTENASSPAEFRLDLAPESLHLIASYLLPHFLESFLSGTSLEEIVREYWEKEGGFQQVIDRSSRVSISQLLFSNDADGSKRQAMETQALNLIWEYLEKALPESLDAEERSKRLKAIKEKHRPAIRSLVSAVFDSTLIYNLRLELDPGLKELDYSVETFGDSDPSLWEDPETRLLQSSSGSDSSSDSKDLLRAQLSGELDPKVHVEFVSLAWEYEGQEMPVGLDFLENRVWRFSQPTEISLEVSASLGTSSTAEEAEAAPRLLSFQLERLEGNVLDLQLIGDEVKFAADQIFSKEGIEGLIRELFRRGAFGDDVLKLASAISEDLLPAYSLPLVAVVKEKTHPELNKSERESLEQELKEVQKAIERLKTSIANRGASGLELSPHPAGLELSPHPEGLQISQQRSLDQLKKERESLEYQLDPPDEIEFEIRVYDDEFKNWFENMSEAERRRLIGVFQSEIPFSLLGRPEIRLLSERGRLQAVFQMDSDFYFQWKPLFFGVSENAFGKDAPILLRGISEALAGIHLLESHPASALEIWMNKDRGSQDVLVEVSFSVNLVEDPSSDNKVARLEFDLDSIVLKADFLDRTFLNRTKLSVSEDLPGLVLDRTPFALDFSNSMMLQLPSLLPVAQGLLSEEKQAELEALFVAEANRFLDGRKFRLGSEDSSEADASDEAAESEAGLLLQFLPTLRSSGSRLGRAFLAENSFELEWKDWTEEEKEALGVTDTDLSDLAEGLRSAPAALGAITRLDLPEYLRFRLENLSLDNQEIEWIEIGLRNPNSPQLLVRWELRPHPQLGYVLLPTASNLERILSEYELVESGLHGPEVGEIVGGGWKQQAGLRAVEALRGLGARLPAVPGAVAQGSAEILKRRGLVDALRPHVDTIKKELGLNLRSMMQEALNGDLSQELENPKGGMFQEVLEILSRQFQLVVTNELLPWFDALGHVRVGDEEDKANARELVEKVALGQAREFLEDLELNKKLRDGLQSLRAYLERTLADFPSTLDFSDSLEKRQQREADGSPPSPNPIDLFERLAEAVKKGGEEASDFVESMISEVNLKDILNADRRALQTERTFAERSLMHLEAIEQWLIEHADLLKENWDLNRMISLDHREFVFQARLEQLENWKKFYRDRVDSIKASEDEIPILLRDQQFFHWLQSLRGELPVLDQRGEISESSLSGLYSRLDAFKKDWQEQEDPRQGPSQTEPVPPEVQRSLGERIAEVLDPPACLLPGALQVELSASGLIGQVLPSFVARRGVGRPRSRQEQPSTSSLEFPPQSEIPPVGFIRVRQELFQDYFEVVAERAAPLLRDMLLYSDMENGQRRFGVNESVIAELLEPQVEFKTSGPVLRFYLKTEQKGLLRWKNQHLIEIPLELRIRNVFLERPELSGEEVPFEYELSFQVDPSRFALRSEGWGEGPGYFLQDIARAAIGLRRHVANSIELELREALVTRNKENRELVGVPISVRIPAMGLPGLMAVGPDGELSDRPAFPIALGQPEFSSEGLKIPFHLASALSRQREAPRTRFEGSVRFSTEPDSDNSSVE
ncbi:MAG: hypothetical protein EA369_04360 [Bradymonadales bacterium]|nr:MAG: hypothetical protein EA369_04360 [Bradymonadales bacterium]